MRELVLHSLHADGEHLILADGSGAQYRLVIDDALRVAIRGDRPHLESIRAGERSTLRPRDIQARIRAGASATEIADSEGLPLAAVERYEGPVLAERAWMVEQTQLLAIGHEVGAPTLGDLVVDRIAARGLSTEVTWDARRLPGDPWEVSVEFDAGQRRRASWHVDLQARSLTALDDESRLLSETDLTGRRGRGPFDVEAEDSRRGADVVISRSAPAAGAPAAASPDDDAAAVAPPSGRAGAGAEAATDSLLERLERARGRRGRGGAALRGEAAGTAQPAPADSADGEAETGGAGDDGLFPAAPVLTFRSPRGGAPEESPAAEGEVEDAADVEDPEPTEPQPTDQEQAPEPTRSRGRSRRTSVPTWDEIVFGSKSE